MASGDVAIEPPKVANAFVPAVLLGKETEIVRALCRASVPAKVVCVDCVTSVRQCFGQPGIPPGVLGKPVRDLDDGFGWDIRQPAIGEERHAIWCIQCEGRSEHRITSPS